MFLQLINIFLLVLTVDGQIITTTPTEPVATDTATTLAIPRTLDRFSQNKISSQEIQILDLQHIFIPQLYFDGNAPIAHFVVGTGLPSKSNQGSIISHDDSDSAMGAFYGQDITLTLPSNLTTSSIDWLAIWSQTEDSPLDVISTRYKTLQSKYPPQTLNLMDKVQSGPIVLVDKKTLFIPNLRFDGSFDDAHFCVGNSTVPSSYCTIIPDENNSTNPLHPYSGENVYIHLPGDITTDNIDFFGVYSKDLSLGHVFLNDIPNVPEVDGTVKSSVMRVPKCCPLNWILTENGCQEAFLQTFEPKVNIYQHNSTHMNNESLPLNQITYAPYYNAMQCLKYPLYAEDEIFGLLLNGSLIVNGNNLKKILSQGEFCMDVIDNAVDEILIFVCAPEEKINQGMFKAYLALLIISTLCLIGAIIVYYVFYKHSDVHKNCFTLYALSMCVTFICQISVQIAYIEGNTGCVIIGFFFQISMIVSFTWLAVLCTDVLLLILYFKEDAKIEKRFFWYIAVVVGVALISLIVSISRNLVPDVPNSFFKPQFKRNSCNFEENDQRTIYFYAPILLCIIVSLVIISYSKWKIIKNNTEVRFDFEWVEKGQNIKFLFKQSLMTWLIMLISWISNFLMNYFDDTNGVFNAMNIIEALQGVLVVALFFAHHYYHLRVQRINNAMLQYETTPINNLEMTALNMSD